MLDLVGDRLCLICESPVKEGYFCRFCLARLLRLRLHGLLEKEILQTFTGHPGFAGAWAAYSYQ